jgi:hypothetical protein
MSTPECDRAQNQIVPAPPKPVNFQPRTISDRIAKRWMEHVDGSREFAALMSSTDVYCTITGDAQETELVFPPCVELTNLNGSSSASLPMQLRRDFLKEDQYFPLPPSSRTQKERWEFGIMFWSLWLLVVLISYQTFPRILWALTRVSGQNFIYDQSFLRVAVARHRTWVRYSLFSNMLWLFSFVFSALFGIRAQAKWAAQDQFLDSCLASGVSVSTLILYGSR